MWRNILNLQIQEANIRQQRATPQVCTVFQAEILGLKIACEQLLNEFNKYKPRYIKIFSDSQAAILALDNSK